MCLTLGILVFSSCDKDNDAMPPEEVLMYSCPDGKPPHAIDLGLPSGTLWACCNLDATNPNEDGGYYAWGETSEKSNYNANTYLFSWIYDKDTYVDSDGVPHNPNYSELYDPFSIFGNEYDAAYVKWGGSWRLPNKPDFEELVKSCSFAFISDSVSGVLFTGPNGNSLFLPKSGWRDGRALVDKGRVGRYWTCIKTSTSPRVGSSLCTDAYFLNLPEENPKFSSSSKISPGVSATWRTKGHSIRPIYYNKQQETSDSQ